MGGAPYLRFASECRRFPLKGRSVCRCQLRNYCGEGGNTWLGEMAFGSITQGLETWSCIYIQVDNIFLFSFLFFLNSVSSIHDSEYIRFVNPGCKLFVESQLKPL